jgi:hypothetical protein
MANKRIIRIIIYEGPEEIIDIYEKRNLKGTIKGGIPSISVKGERNDTAKIARTLTAQNIEPFVKITAETIEENVKTYAALSDVIGRHAAAKI